MIVICPKCQYGFESAPASEYTCPRADCAHHWRPRSQTMADAFLGDGREGHAELLGLGGEVAGRTFPLTLARSVIGRGDEAQIALTNLSVSRAHCEVLRVGSEWALHDLGSRAGTFLNGNPVVEGTPLRIGDQVLIVGNLFEFRVRYGQDEHAPRQAARGSRASEGVTILQGGQRTERVVLGGETLTVGRTADRDLVLQHPMVSGRHAVLEREGDAWFVTDTRSANGTLVNDRAVLRARLVRGDHVQFGPVVFLFDGASLVFQPRSEAVCLRAEGLTTRVPTGTLILDDVSLEIEPGLLVGLIGPSGAGKTTLLNALSGFRPAADGRVRYNGLDLAEHYDALKTRIGYVPQDDIIHQELTAREALTYSARLRLPRDTDRDEIDALVVETLDILGLGERADLPIHRLSGGQRKRASLGVELLTRCNVLFLDEPTSGLDPATEARMMALFRRLADQGRTLVLTTHVMESIDVLDRVAIMYGGKLVYYGPPDRALKHFGAARATHLYDRLEEFEPEVWAERFRASDLYRPPAADAAQPPDEPERPVDGRSRRAELGGKLWRQLTVLTGRYARMIAVDKRTLALLLVQPIIIFAFLGLTFGKAFQVLFMGAVSMFWIGCTNAAREIVREQSIYRRERAVTLLVAPYVLSKVLVLTAFCLLQAGIAVAFIKLASGIDGSWWRYLVVLFAATLSGMSLGLVISAVVNKPEHSDAIVPIALIPQIIYAGVIEPIADMNLPSRLLSYGISTRWTYESLQSVFREYGYEAMWVDTLIVLGFATALLVGTGMILKLRKKNV
jgi:ABC-type multidrug transport system ATPase subunit/pSer/pThr/pTyr-binding forkhead associated (FHA) protein